MGEIRADLKLWSDDESRSIDLRDTMVDTGATYSLVPRAVLEELGVQPTGKAYAELADGRVIEYDRGAALVSINGDTAVTPVLFGHEGEEPLIGVVTLEILALAADPVGQQLVPVRFIRR